MTELPELDGGLWLSVTQLAERKGVRKSTISEKVARLVALEKLTVKPGKGRERLINVAQYDFAVGEVGDGAREQGAVTKAANAAAAETEPTLRAPFDPRLRDEQTRDKAYSADIKFLQLEQLRGNLLVVAEFDAVAEDAASRIADIIDALLSQDADLTSIAVKEGENGMRAALKRIVRQMRTDVVEALKQMAVTARARAKTVGANAPIGTDTPLVPAEE